jgi:AcrR family transcriptional regulator
MSSKRGPYSSPRQRQRRHEILAAVRSQVAEHGLSSVTMKNIAEAGGVSTKTLYNLFGSRDLLLLAAVAELLDDLETSEQMRGVEAGIPTLMTFTEHAMQAFEGGEFARYFFHILLGAEPDHPDAQAQLGRIQRIAFKSLLVAAEKGELEPGLNLEQISYAIAANQWGAAVLWEKGMLELEELRTQTRLGHCLILATLCRGERKKQIQQECQRLLALGQTDAGNAVMNLS